MVSFGAYVVVSSASCSVIRVISASFQYFPCECINVHLDWIRTASPRSIDSSWSELELQVITLLTEDVERIEAMAMGNNLIAVDVYRAAPSSAYFTAYLRLESVVLMDPQLDGELLLITSEKQSVDLVPLDGEISIELSDWVWCDRISVWKGMDTCKQHSSVHSTQSIGRKPQIAHHRLQENFKLRSSSTLESPIPGHRVDATTRLRGIASHSAVLSVLESLRVRHDGSFWANDNCDLLVAPQLTNLVLRLPRGKCPRSMGIFRFTISGAQPIPDRLSESRPHRLP